MNNNRQVPGSNQGGGGDPLQQSSPLSLLAQASANDRDNNARDSGRGGQQQQGGNVPGHSFADQLRLRGLAGLGGGDVGSGLSFEETLLQQQAAHQQSQQNAFQNNLLQQLREQNLLQQYGSGSQNHQLASLLGLGGGGGGMHEMRNAIAAAQMRHQAQPPQLSHADIMALSRTPGGLSGLLGLGGGAGLGGGGLGGGAGLASELENLQRLEELERRQRLLSATGGGGQLSGLGGGVDRSMDVSGTSGHIIRDERIPGGHIPRPSAAGAVADSGGASASAAAAAVTSKNKASKAVPASKTSNNADAAEGEGAAVAIKSNNDDANGEELEKTPGSVIVPCRARGMPMDHNFKTAYFVIPEKVRHGEELICSYFACRNAGIKFRYCSHCKVPVAKRNFRKRHKHGGEDIRGGDDSGGEEEVAAKKGIPAQITAKCEEAMEADALSSQSADSNVQSKQQTELGIQQGLVRSSMRSFEKKSKANNSGVAALGPGDDKITPARQNRWTTLLAKRPATKDGDSMSAWLMEVLAVSDLDTPLNKPSEAAGAASAAGGGKAKRGKKNAVERAANNDSPRSDMGDSSNDESGEGAPEHNKKRGAKNDAKPAANKKKRSAAAAAAAKEDSEANDEAYVSGSFAEWKERKKQKKQGKVNPTQEAEV